MLLFIVIVDGTGDEEIVIPDEDDMMKLMGFAGFNTTKVFTLMFILRYLLN